MTVVAGFLAADACYVAEDSIFSLGQFVEPEIRDVKHVHVRGVSAWATGCPDVLILVREALNQMLGDEDAPLKRRVSQFGSFMRAQLYEHGWQPEQGEDAAGNPPTWHSDLLLTDGRSLYEVLGSMNPFEVSRTRIAAVGAGSGLAIASATALKHVGISNPADLVRISALTACKHLTNCQTPVRVYAVGPGKPPQLLHEAS